MKRNLDGLDAAAVDEQRLEVLQVSKPHHRRPVLQRVGVQVQLEQVRKGDGVSKIGDVKNPAQENFMNSFQQI